MPKHTEKRALPYTAKQMFDLVADIERYPEYLPWCKGARISRNEGNVLYVDLIIGFRMFRERFGSRVVLERPGKIDVTYTHGPFHYLENHWRFSEAAEGCVIEFSVDFEFRSRLLRRLIGPLFTEAVHRMVRSFELRAGRIYGSAARAKTKIGSRQLDRA